MSSTTVRTPPRWPNVVAEQIRLLLLLQRRDLLGLAVLAVIVIGLMTAEVLSMQRNPTPEWSLTFQFLPNVAPLCALVAFFWAFPTWRHEEPRRRAYHWSMPLPRGTHGLLRVGAGWLVAMGMVGALLATLTAAALVMGANSAVTGPPLAHWLLPFATASLGYLFGSALLVASNHAARWLVYGLVGSVAFGVLVIGAGGLPSTLIKLIIRVPSSALYAAGVLDLRIEGQVGIDSWWAAFLLWSAVGGAALALALNRHRNA